VRLEAGTNAATLAPFFAAVVRVGKAIRLEDVRELLRTFAEAQRASKR